LNFVGSNQKGEMIAVRIANLKTFRLHLYI